MRYLTLLFAFYLFVLAISPALAMLSCSQSTEQCSMNCRGDEEPEKAPGNCPFGICCTSCLFFNVEQQEFRIIRIPVASQKIWPANEMIHSSYSADCWHPPELV